MRLLGRRHHRALDIRIRDDGGVASAGMIVNLTVRRMGICPFPEALRQTIGQRNVHQSLLMRIYVMQTWG